MNYSAIIKKSYEIIFKNRFLWFLGLFLGTASTSQVYNYSPSDINVENVYKYFQDHNLKSLGNFASANNSPIFQATDSSTIGFIILFLVILSIVFLLIYISLTARGAATIAIANINKGAEENLKSSWAEGKVYFWRRLSFGLFLIILCLVIPAIFVAPIIVLLILQYFKVALGIGIVFGLVLFVYFVYLSLIFPIAERLLFLENTGILESFRVAVKRFNKNWLEFVLLYLINIGFTIAYALVFMIIFALIVLLLFLIAYFIFTISHIAAYIIGGIFIIALITTALTLWGAFSSFSWSLLTLGFLEAKKS